MHPDGSQRQEWDHNYFLLHRPEDPASAEAMKEWEVLDDDPTLPPTSHSVDLTSLMRTRDPQDQGGSPTGTLFALNVVTCNRNVEVRRGATVLAVALLSESSSICLSNGWATGFIPLLRSFLAEALLRPTERRDLMTQLYSSLNSPEARRCLHRLSFLSPFHFGSQSFFLVRNGGGWLVRKCLT